MNVTMFLNGKQLINCQTTPTYNYLFYFFLIAGPITLPASLTITL